MIKRILICVFITTSVLAMEERESRQDQEKSTPEEVGFKAVVASYLNKLPKELRKKIEDYLLFEKIPTEIKTLIAKSLVDSVKDQADALELRKDLKNISQINREFRDIVNSESFTNYTLKHLMKKLDIDPLFAAALLASPSAAKSAKQWIRDNIDRIIFLRLNNLPYELTYAGDSLGAKFIQEIKNRYTNVFDLLNKAKDVDSLNKALDSMADFTQNEKAIILNLYEFLSPTGRAISFIRRTLLELDPARVERLLQFAKNNLPETEFNEIFNLPDNDTDYRNLGIAANAEKLAAIIELLKLYGSEDSWLLETFTNALEKARA